MMTEPDKDFLWRAWLKSWVTTYVFFALIIIAAYFLLGGEFTESAVKTLLALIFCLIGFGVWDWRSMLHSKDPKKSIFATNKERNGP